MAISACRSNEPENDQRDLTRARRLQAALPPDISEKSSRAGLRPSPTCQSRQGGRPKGDVASSATNG